MVCRNALNWQCPRDTYVSYGYLHTFLASTCTVCTALWCALSISYSYNVLTQKKKRWWSRKSRRRRKRGRVRQRKKSFCCWLRPASIGYSTQRLSGLLSLKLEHKLRLILLRHTHICVCRVCLCIVCRCLPLWQNFCMSCCHYGCFPIPSSSFPSSWIPFLFSYVCPRPSQLEPWHCLSTTLVASCAPAPLPLFYGVYMVCTYCRHIHRHYM